MSDRVPLFWFHIDGADDARAVTRRAGYAGAATAALTAALAAWAVASPGSLAGSVLDSWSFLDVAIILTLSVGTFRGNRFAAVALLVVYVVEQVVTRISTGGTGGIVVSVLFVAVFVQGAIGAVVLHRLRPEGEIEEQVGALEAGLTAHPDTLRAPVKSTKAQ